MAKRGKKISHLMPCPYCGEEIAEDALFCPSCGNSISSPLRGGTLLHNGRYKIIKQLGAGGMATIYLAEDINLETHYVLSRLWQINSMIKNRKIIL